MEKAINDYIEAHTDNVSFLLDELITETEKITGHASWSIGK